MATKSLLDSFSTEFLSPFRLGEKRHNIHSIILHRGAKAEKKNE